MGQNLASSNASETALPERFTTSRAIMSYFTTDFHFTFRPGWISQQGVRHGFLATDSNVCRQPDLNANFRLKSGYASSGFD